MRTATLVTALLALAASGAQAQQAAGDARWLAWVGCWEGAPEGTAETDAAYLVCIHPLGTSAAPGSGVQLVTYSGGEMVSTEILTADGAPAPAEEGGCSGTRTARWSGEGTALFLASDLSCGDGLVRSTRGVLALLDAERGWIEIHGVRADGVEPVLGIRSFVPAAPELLREAGVTDPTAGIELAVSTSRARAGRTLTVDAVAEVVREAGPEVASALVLEKGDPFDLDAGMLRSLRDRGVPGEVVDVMVAVTYPERFQLGGPDGTRPEVREVRTAERAVAPWPDRGPRVRVRGYSPWGFGYSDPYWYYGYGYYGYDYYYGPFGYGPFGRSYYDYPRIIVVSPPTVQERGARLDPERGLVPPENATTRPAGPRPNQASASSGSGSRSSSSSGGGSSSSSARPRSDGGGSSSSSARPRPDGGSTRSGASGSGESDAPVRRAVPR